MAIHDGAEAFGPPFSTELLADLHAGVLPDDVSARLWPLVREDRAALDVIAALDAVSARLGEVGRDHSVGTPIPPEVAARIEASLRETDSRPAAPVASLEDARSRRRARTWIAVAVASTAAAIGVVFMFSAVDRGESTAPTVLATPTAGPAEPDIADLGSDLDGGTVLALMRGGQSSRPADVGPLADPETRASCLQANGFDRATPVLGTRAVHFRESDAVLLLVAGPTPPALTALVVDKGCDAAHPGLLTRTVIG